MSNDTTPPPVGLTLGGEFTTRSASDWRAAVDKVIARGDSELTPEQLAERYRRELVTETVDGLTIQPLYTDRGTAPEPGVAGAAPFTRGTAVLAHRQYGWDVRQRVVATPDADETHLRVLDELERGATSILLDLGAIGAPVDVGAVADSPGASSLAVGAVTTNYLGAVLAGIHLDIAPVALTGATGTTAAVALLDLLDQRRATAGDEQSVQPVAVLGLDPIGRWAVRGRGDVATELADAVSIANRCAEQWISVRAIVIDATVVHESGGGDVEELAYAAAAGLHVVRALVEAGLDIDAAFGQLEFRFAATPDQFLTMAKMRAARRMWQRVGEVCGASTAAQAQRQHAVSSRAAASRYDIWVNLLRGTVECFGAGVGGADAVTILPHDDLVEPGGSDLGRRMARNTQVVLIEESNLAKVIDMAGGSWYVEQLTDQLARTSWALMQDLERAGGVVTAISTGVLQQRIEATSTRRQTAIGRRTLAITGVTEFPNIADPSPADVPTDRHDGTNGDTDGAATDFQPLRPNRYADRVEAQRGRSDHLAAGPGGRPTVYLAALGPTSANAARVTFAKNMFEAGGIAAIVGDSATDPTEVRQGFERSGAHLVCICSSDKLYRDLAVPVAEALRDAGAARIYLAGRPKDMDTALAAAGVDEQIAAGGDIVAVLQTALDTIGANA